MKLYENTYLYMTYLFYVLYVLTMFGLWNNSNKYLVIVKYTLQILIGIILVIMNNPFSKHKCTKTDKQIAFSAGIFVLTSTSLDTFIDLIKSAL